MTLFVSRRLSSSSSLSGRYTFVRCSCSSIQEFKKREKQVKPREMASNSTNGRDQNNGPQSRYVASIYRILDFAKLTQNCSGHRIMMAPKCMSKTNRLVQLKVRVQDYLFPISS